MDDKQVLPYGSWPTPITSELVVARAVAVWEVAVDGRDVIWGEERPAEGGRTALVRRFEDGERHELLAREENARTAVHEYGGGAWWVDHGIVWFANWTDQRLYRRDPAMGRSEALTPAPEIPQGDRYADGSLSPDRRSIVCVRERHPPGAREAIAVRNEIVRLAAHEPSTPEVLVSGPDFVSSPRFSPDGSKLCWLEWDHPNMPWDGTRLIVRDLISGEQRLIAGGERESISEPRWQSDGSLTLISDRNGWWNLYRWSGQGDTVEALIEVEAEIGQPQWEFGQSRYASLADGRIVFARTRDGLDGLGIRLADGAASELELPFSAIHCVAGDGEASVVVVGASASAEASVVRVTFGPGPTIERVEMLRPSRDLGVDPADISLPEPLDYQSADGRIAHALLYRPANRSYRGPDGELPPLLVCVHGGPTGCASAALRLEIQYLTSRGFVVADVNYGGSTGYGRSYRELLNGNWGVVDVEDTVAVARHLVERGEADPARLCVSGGSAGGYTTLACLASADTPFRVGTDLFGLADLESFVQETHKFESRYLERLVGPYPQARAAYRERSPINHVDVFSRPLLVLQGLEDAVVPASQSMVIVEALRAKGVPVAYVAFEGEQHGFRREANIRRAVEAELSFYAQILGFELPPGERIEPVPINGR